MKSQLNSDASQKQSPIPETIVTATVNPHNAKPNKVELRFTAGKNRLRVGRDPLNELLLETALVSRFHAALLLRPDGRLLVSDLSEGNNTFLNGRQLDEGAVYELKDNDLVRFGDAEVRFNFQKQTALKNQNEREITLTFPQTTVDPDAVPHSAIDEAKPPQISKQTVDEAIEEETIVRHAVKRETKPVIQTKAAAPKTENTSTNVARSAGIVSIAVMGSRVVGLVREQIFAAVFGAGFLYDAYLVAFRIPNLLRDLFAEGALSTAFVKTFTDYQVKKSEAEAWQLASLVFNALVVILSVVSLAGILLAPFLINLIAWDFPADKAALTTTMTQIMFPFILLVAMAAVAMGVLNTKGVFGIPASASTVFNIVSIITGLGLAYYLSGGQLAIATAPNETPDAASQWAIIGMSIGTLIGGAAQFLMQLPALFKVGFRFRPILNFTDPGVLQVFRLMTPAILGTSAVQINVVVNTLFVSGIEGGQSWLNCAFRLMQLPIGIFGVAVATASVPTLSKFAAQNDLGKFRETLGNGMRLVFLLTLPSACGLIVLGEPIIRLIYEHGNFNPLATSMTAWALAAYSIGLAGYAAIKVLSPAFYALDDARTPMIISLASIAVNAVTGYFFRITLSQVGVTEATPSGLGHVGVALATSTIALVNFLALLLLMKRKIKRIEGGKTIASLAKVAIASALLSAVCYFSYHFLHNVFAAQNLLFKVIEVFAPIALGGIVFLIAAKLLGVAELNQAVNAFTRKFKKAKS